MNQLDHNKKLGEILKQARDALNEELLSRQTNAYQVWLDSCNLAWQTRGTLLPPNSVKLIYPTEKDIVNRALEIYNALNPVPVVIDAPAANTADALPVEVPTEVPTEEVVAESTTEPAPEVDAVSDTEIKEKFSSLLTKWGGQGHY
jgi:hypothetical protein